MRELGEGLESGRFTQAEFERKHRMLMIELQHQADKGRKKIKNWAITVTKTLRDEDEYKRLCAHYHDEYGDSFHHLLTSLYAGATFVTLNDKMLDDARLAETALRGQDPDAPTGGGSVRERRAGESSDGRRRRARNAFRKRPNVKKSRPKAHNGGYALSCAANPVGFG